MRKGFSSICKRILLKNQTSSEFKMISEKRNTMILFSKQLKFKIKLLASLRKELP